MSKSIPEKDIDWAIKIFRPVLKDLGISKLKNDKLVFTDNYSNLIKNKIIKCVIVIKKFRFLKSAHEGIFVWQYDEQTDMHALYILLNENLFHNNDVETNKIKKAVAVHEFTHCVATMLTISQLETKLLIERQNKRMERRIHAIESNDTVDLFKDMLVVASRKKAEYMLSFPDSHFRTGSEDFQQSYSELYCHLLFSYQIFLEFFTDDVFNEIKKLASDQNALEIKNIIEELINQISEEKKLEINFVRLQTDQFISKYLEHSVTAT